jgi:hypothetical protein
MKVTVISTAIGPVGRRCIDSVRSQVGVDVEHVCIDSAPEVTKLENLVAAISRITPLEVVALVDGDDWLAHDKALARVARLHAEGAWLTYGSFRYSDGRAGFAGPHRGPSAPWSATHLKTFRAGLFNAIRYSDLRFDGKWIDRADDVAFMLPMLAMASERAVYEPNVHYVYDLSSSWEWQAPPAARAHDKRIETHVRSLPPYTRLESLT